MVKMIMAMIVIMLMIIQTNDDCIKDDNKHGHKYKSLLLPNQMNI